LSLDNITDIAEVRRIRPIYDRLFRQRYGWDMGEQFDLATDESGGEPRLPQLLQPSKYAPELPATNFLENARAIARQIYGDELKPTFAEHMIYKPARVGAATPWHQDEAYGDPNRNFRNITFWLTLDDASIDSGCMQFVPGSCRWDVKPHHSVNFDPRVHGLEIDEPETMAASAAVCPVPVGGGTMHGSYTLHHTGPNITSHPRRAYILLFGAPSTKRDVPFDNYWMREKRTARMARARDSGGVDTPSGLPAAPSPAK